MTQFPIDKAINAWMAAALLAPIGSALLLWGTKIARYRVEGWNNTSTATPIIYVAAFIFIGIAFGCVAFPFFAITPQTSAETHSIWKAGFYILLGSLLCIAIAVTGFKSFSLAGCLRKIPREGQAGLESLDTLRRISVLRSAAWGLIILPACLFLSVPLTFVIVIASLPYWIANTIATHKLGKKCHLLWHLALASRLERPFTQTLQSYAGHLPETEKMQVSALAENMQTGVPLAEALQLTPGLLPSYMLPEIQAAEASGTLSQKLQQLAVKQTQWLQSRSVVGASFLSYFGILLTIVGVTVSFLSVYIIPKFLRIFEEFGIETTEGTFAIFGYGQSTSNHFFLIAPLLSIAVASFVLQYISFRRDWRDIDLPIMSFLFPKRHTPQVLRSLATGVAQGQSLSNTLNTLVELHAHKTSHFRLSKVAQLTEQGEDCWKLLQIEKFINAQEMQVLATAQKTGHLAWALDQLADNIEQQSSRRMKIVAQIIQPLLIFTVGLIVAYVCWAVFSPLMSLLNHESLSAP